MSKAAIRYAKAVLELANEQNTTKAIRKAMQKIRLVFSGSKPLRDLLHSPLVKSGIKKQTLKAVFPDWSPTMNRLLDVLIANKRIALLEDVADQFLILHDKASHKLVAQVTTAVPISKKAANAVEQKLMKITANKVHLESFVDASILGGFILKIGDTQYNSSIRDQFKNLQNILMN